MKNNSSIKINRNHILILIYAIFALSEILIYWIFRGQGKEWVETYNHVILYLVLPLGSLFLSYMFTVDKAPKGLKMLIPLAFGVAISLTEYLSYSLGDILDGKPTIPSIILLLYGVFASLFGFTFAKQDRAENARIEKAKKKQQAMCIVADEGEDEIREAAPKKSYEDDYNPGREFIPDDDDTWADEVIAKEGFGELKVEYAEHDADFSIDSPEGETVEDIVEEATVEEPEMGNEAPTEEAEAVAEEATGEQTEDDGVAEDGEILDDGAVADESLESATEDETDEADVCDDDSTDDDAKEDLVAEESADESLGDEGEGEEALAENDEENIEE